MNWDILGSVICEVEHIINGIAEEMEKIAPEEWKENGRFGGVCAHDDEDNVISFNKVYYSLYLETKPEYQLEFANYDEAETRINNAFKYLRESKLSFDILEVVFYSLLSMVYVSMRKHKAEDIEKIDDYIQKNIPTLSEDKGEQKYLQMLNSISFLNIAYLFNSINGNEENELTEIKYTNEFQRLLSAAKELLPNGQIAELISEIFLVEKFFKEPTDDNIDKINRDCFGKEGNWMKHIFTCASPRLYQLNQRWRHYIPHIAFVDGSDNKISILADIMRCKPERKKGYWGNITQEQLNSEQMEYEYKMEEWEKESYFKILMQPYQVHTNESKGELIYVLLEVLSENKELEETKNSIVSDFTHSYGNYEIDNVYHIAKALNENPSKEDLEDYGRELLLEYLNKQMMTKEVKMLRLEHKDNFDELQKVISDSIDFSREGISIYEIVKEALKRVILRILLEEGNRRISSIIEKYEKRNMDPYELLEKFEKQVIREDQDSIEWVNNNMNSFYVNISKEWEKVSFYRNSEGNVFLMSLFMELLFNMFTYASIDHDMKLIMSYEPVDDGNYYVVKTENNVDQSIASNTKKGLAARNRVLGKINYGKEYRWKNSILKEYVNNNTECIVKARIKADLFGGTV